MPLSRAAATPCILMTLSKTPCASAALQYSTAIGNELAGITHTIFKGFPFRSTPGVDVGLSMVKLIRSSPAKFIVYASPNAEHDFP